MVMALVISLLLTACNNKENKSDAESKTSIKCNSIRRDSFLIPRKRWMVRQRTLCKTYLKGCMY